MLQISERTTILTLAMSIRSLRLTIEMQHYQTDTGVYVQKIRLNINMTFTHRKQKTIQLHETVFKPSHILVNVCA